MMSITPILYWTDFLVYTILFGILFFLYSVRKKEGWKRFIRTFSKKPLYQVSVVILIFYGLVGFMDSLHFKDNENRQNVKSLLDVFLPYENLPEETYSAPFAIESYDPVVKKLANGSSEQTYARLNYAGQHLLRPQDKASDIAWRSGGGVLGGLLLTLVFYLTLKFICKKRLSRTIWITLGTLFCILTVIYFFVGHYHILGTDKVGRDVFYLSIKSIRTGLIIGTVTTFVMLPFAVLLGMGAGYFRGWVDDIIQYIYTTLSSVPGILLIAAAVLSLQVKIEQDPELRLLVLCIILGVTSWTGLCRLVRGETLKLREMDFVQAAISLGVSRSKIMMKHILPNLGHIIIITLVLDFSGLVLAEAILSYVGVGVAPTSYSWGNLINASRLEMARDPMVWWSLLGAFILMFVLVFSANLFSDAVQKALDPRRG